MKPLWHWSNQPPEKIAEILVRISEKRKGCKPNSGSFKLGQINKFKGKTLPWIGHSKPHTEEAKARMRTNASIRRGSANNKWKGDLVGNKALHGWVKRQLGRPMTCEFCGFTTDNVYKIHWANISHKYRRDLKDWIRLCVSCHKRYDLGQIKI